MGYRKSNLFLTTYFLLIINSLNFKSHGHNGNMHMIRIFRGIKFHFTEKSTAVF